MENINLNGIETTREQNIKAKVINCETTPEKTKMVKSLLAKNRAMEKRIQKNYIEKVAKWNYWINENKKLIEKLQK